MDSFLVLFNSLLENGFDPYPATFIACILLVLCWYIGIYFYISVVIYLLKPKYYIFWYEDSTFSVEKAINYKFIRKRCEKKYNVKSVRVDEFKDKDLLYVFLISSGCAHHNANQIKSIFIDSEKKDFLEY